MNIRLDTIKLLEENLGNKLMDFDLGSNFLGPKAQITKAKNPQRGYIELKSFCIVKETTEFKKNLQNWRQFCEPYFR